MCEMVTCYCCGNEIDVDEANVVEGEYVCDSCYDEETFECDCCGDRTFILEYRNIEQTCSNVGFYNSLIIQQQI